MLPKTGWILGLGLIAMLSLGAVTAWGETEDGHVWVAKHADHDDAEVVKLSDLADGETRTFDTEKGQIVASRDGDDILLTIRKDGEEEHSFKCVANRDECMVITAKGGEPGATALVIKKRAFGDHGEEVDVDMMVLGGHHAMAHGKALFIGEGDGNIVRLHTGHEGMNVEVKDGAHVIHIEQSGTVLRCPEGDTTMRVEEEDADETYYCPKHDVALVKAENQFVHEIRTVVVEEDDHDEDED
jgi:hypothetical protein